MVIIGSGPAAICAARAQLQRQHPDLSVRRADGRSLPVPHPDFVAVTPRRIIVVANDGSWSVVEPLLAVSLDYGPSGRKAGNGRPKKKR